MYGDRENFEVSCPTSGISIPITFGLKQGSSEYQGIDCLDDGELVDSVKVGALAEVTSLPAASIGANVNWYIDFDNDGYGVDRTLGVSSIDDANSDFILDVLADENVPVIFGDDDTNGIPDGCYLDKPSYETATRTIYYTLNHEDCNDSTTFEDDSGESSVAQSKIQKQNGLQILMGIIMDRMMLLQM